MNNSDSDSDPEDQRDTHYGTSLPTRDSPQSDTHDGTSSPTRDSPQSDTHDGTSLPTRDSPQSDTYYGQSSSEEGEGDSNGDSSPFRNDEDSPTNQSPSPYSWEEDEDEVSTDKRQQLVRQIAAAQNSDEKSRLETELAMLRREPRSESL